MTDAITSLVGKGIPPQGEDRQSACRWRFHVHKAKIAIATGWLRLNPRPEKEKLERPTLPLLVKKFSNLGLAADEAIIAMKRAKTIKKPDP